VNLLDSLGLDEGDLYWYVDVNGNAIGYAVMFVNGSIPVYTNMSGLFGGGEFSPFCPSDPKMFGPCQKAPDVPPPQHDPCGPFGIFCKIKPPEPDPCKEIPPPAPPTVNIRENIASAERNRDYVKGEWRAVIEHVNWFYLSVRNKGPYDMKNVYGAQYQAFGNFHFGAVGTAAGFPEQILLRAAGYAQEKAGTSQPGWSHWWGRAPYGDDPVDQEWIKWGVWFYGNCPP
jgi:hypothetical protein